LSGAQSNFSLVWVKDGTQAKQIRNPGMHVAKTSGEGDRNHRVFPGFDRAIHGSISSPKKKAWAKTRSGPFIAGDNREALVF
jgi:hypothetical protein